MPDLGFELSPGGEFWALLPSFAILTLVLGLKTISDGVVIQQGSRRRPRAIDFRRIQGIVSVNGIGMLLAGLATTLPPMANASYSLSLINLTGVAARRVGIGVAVVILFLAFFSKFAAVLLTIPGPVVGAFLMLAMGMLFVSGWQTILRDGLDPRRMLTVALASALGLGLHGHPIMDDLFGNELGGLLGNGVTIGALVAIVMTALFDLFGTRRSRLEVTLDMASLPAIDEFLSGLASRMNWDDPSTLRLRSAGEETLATLLVTRRRYGRRPAAGRRADAPEDRRPAATGDGRAGVRRHDPPGEHRRPARLSDRRSPDPDGGRSLAASALVPRRGRAPPEVPRRRHRHGPGRRRSRSGADLT